MQRTASTFIFLLMTCIGTAQQIGPEAVQDESALLAALESESWTTRRDAAARCADVRTPAIAKKLEFLATQDAQHPVRGRAIESLGKWADPKRFDLFDRIITADPDHWVRGHAMVALGRTRDRGAAALLRTHLDGPCAGAAARGIAASGDKSSFDALANQLRTGLGRHEVRDSFPDAMLDLDLERGSKVLLECFDIADEAAMFALAHALARRPTAAALDRMRPLAFDRSGKTDATKRRAAMIVVGAKPDKRDAAAFLDEFGLRTDDKERREIAEYLSRSPTKGLAGRIMDLAMNENDLATRVALIVAVGRSGEAELVDRLEPLLADRSVSEQPMDISRIFGFPWNVAIRDAAAWSIIHLLQKSEPLPPQDLSSFRETREPTRLNELRDRIAAWRLERVKDRERAGDR